MVNGNTVKVVGVLALKVVANTSEYKAFGIFEPDPLGSYPNSLALFKIGDTAANTNMEIFGWSIRSHNDYGCITGPNWLAVSKNPDNNNARVALVQEHCTTNVVSIDVWREENKSSYGYNFYDPSDWSDKYLKTYAISMGTSNHGM